MASYTAIAAKHATLAANTADTVTLSSVRQGGEVEVLNRGSDYIYFTVSGTAPTVAGDEAFIVAPSGALKVGAGVWAAGVKLISASATAYSVQAA
jgi:hypothetical protein